MDQSSQAPWYFRKRFTVFGMVYGVSIFTGYVLTGLIGAPPVRAYVASGHPWLGGAIALACAAGGYALRVWASSYLSADVVWHDDVQGGALRVSGPYRFTRNPLYLGNMLQAIGIGLLFPWPVLVLLCITMPAFCVALASVEERFLSREHGAAYERYRASVPPFFPLPWRVAPGGERGSLADGVRSEKMTAAFAAAVLVMLVVTWPR